MAFIRVEHKKSGHYFSLMESYKEGGVSKHRVLYSFGKVENYTKEQLESIGKKILELSGKSVTDIESSSISELGRYNYGFNQMLDKLWKVFKTEVLVNKINKTSKVEFDWEACLKLMIVERLSNPCSKLRSHANQSKYMGFQENIKLHHLYRTLDLLSKYEQNIKGHFFKMQRDLSNKVLDVVFYDVTTLYFDSQDVKEGSLRQKGYSKDGKAHKTQIVLGLLVDNCRNPVSYEVYQGNTYEGKTMLDALNTLKKNYRIGQVIVVADSAMIDKENREFMMTKKIDYILGDRLKNLNKSIQNQLINLENHTPIGKEDSEISYKELKHEGRRIICTYSSKRAKKDAFERQKLIDKANDWLDNPSKYNQVRKRGAGKFIQTDNDGTPSLNLDKIKEDAVFDGFKAISTSTNLPVEEVCAKYSDLFEVEHAFRTLKSQLEVRPMFHWTNERIKGHVCMCFIAYTFLNYLRNKSQLQYRELLEALDEMQVSKIIDNTTKEQMYLRASISKNQETLINTMSLKRLPELFLEGTDNQFFK